MSPTAVRVESTTSIETPEQADAVMRVTRVRGWLALVAISLLLLVCGVGAFTVQIPDQVRGRGILVRGEGVLQVVSPAAGRLTDISVGIGDSVSQGQVIAWLAQPELVEQLQLARQTLATARRDLATTVETSRQQLKLETASLDAEQASVQLSTGDGQANQKVLKDREKTREQLLADGLITRSTLLETQQQYNDIAAKLRENATALSQLSVRRLQAAHLAEATMRTSQAAVALAEAEVARRERELPANTQVVSIAAGRVLELIGEPGMVVSRGDPILTFDRRGAANLSIVAVIYVPSQFGKTVRPGMRINLALATVRQEEFGTLVGTVSFVSDFPATQKGMMRVLKNENLVQELSGTSTPYEIHATIDADSSTSSGFRWSSSKGPAIKIESGTLSVGMITTTARRPAEMVLPALRRLSSR